MAELTPEDVARLRANIEKHGPPPLSPMLIFMLMGALEQAWAERDAEHDSMLQANEMAHHWRERAERAEAFIRSADRDANLYRRDAEKANAALARVRALCDESDEYPICAYSHASTSAIRAAIEGDNP